MPSGKPGAVQETVLAEVLQNSRRAGARTVAIDVLGKEGNRTVIVRDDGHGIANMAKLVAFGSSDWNERTDVTENAAGMGVFSLASRGVTVRSLGKRVTLNRAVFCGEADAVVLPDPEAVRGAELMFPAKEAGVESAIAHATRFYPVPVTLNGEQADQHDFLEGAAYTVEWQGLRFGVFRNGEPSVRDLSSRWSYASQLYLNFGGHVVFQKDPIEISEVNDVFWRVAVDIVSAPDLRLVLPTRNEAIENEFFAAMRSRGERAIYECISRQEKHSLAFAKSQRARELGITLPSVEICLNKWVMPSERLKHDYAMGPVILGKQERDIILVPDCRGIEKYAEANLHLFCAGWADSPLLVNEATAFSGYPAYDALPVVADLVPFATAADGKVAELPGFSGGKEETSAVADRIVVDRIDARLMLRSQGSTIKDVELLHAASMPFVFTSDPDWEFPGVMAVAGSNPNELAEALLDCFFEPSEDVDADSYDRQLEVYAADARDFARTLLLSEGEAAISRVIDELQRIGWCFRALGGARIEIDLSAEEKVIQVNTVEGLTRRVPF